MAKRHDWKTNGAMQWACSRCGMRKRFNQITPSRPYYSIDDGKTWDTTEYGYVPPCVEPGKEVK